MAPPPYQFGMCAYVPSGESRCEPLGKMDLCTPGGSGCVGVHPWANGICNYGHVPVYPWERRICVGVYPSGEKDRVDLYLSGDRGYQWGCAPLGGEVCHSVCVPFGEKDLCGRVPPTPQMEQISLRV